MKHITDIEVSKYISGIEDMTAAGKRCIAGFKKHTPGILTVGITGSAGCGKSTLIDCLIDEYRRQNKKVAVLAVDPSSPRSGGALLGDRIRMQRHATDKNVFIRSFATRGSAGGLSECIETAIKIFDRAGKDVAIVETVGAGQDETAVDKIADIVAVITTPDATDDIQLLKAGIIEIADVLVVNKIDINRNVNAGHLGRLLNIPVVETSALLGEGIGELVTQIEKLAADKRTK
ncbi:MAG: ATP-binding cassette domain-containing protein [Elusimicrobia bacterium]|nr:ATP-binding cassette domain-containing protein [Elusimicrobiota bacterium]